MLSWWARLFENSVPRSLLLVYFSDCITISRKRWCWYSFFFSFIVSYICLFHRIFLIYSFLASTYPINFVIDQNQLTVIWSSVLWFKSLCVMQLLGIVAAAPNGLRDYSVHPKESEFVIGPVVAIKTTFVKLFYLAEVLLFPHTSLVNSNDDYLF